jgi:DNA polymerase-4
MSRWIAHVDMDAFFVGVELLRRPELRGKPVIVATGTDPHARGVVMAASYEARKFGVHSALPLTIAHRRCPQAVLVPRDMALYREHSRQVMGMLDRYSECVEVAGLDEAYLDLSEEPLPKSCCRRIKHEIRSETGLTCSVGLAPNKLLAKIASELDKPDGFYVLRREEMLEAVGAKPAGLIPGVGPKTVERLTKLGISTVAQLAAAPSNRLERAFGPRQGHSLHARANGYDDRTVEVERERKSESRETTFTHDVSDPSILRETLDRLVIDLCRNLSSSGHRGRTVTLKIRLRPFRTYTRSRTIEQATADAAVIGSVARELLDGFEVDAPVRLLGVGLASLQRNDVEQQPELAGPSASAPSVDEWPRLHESSL